MATLFGAAEFPLLRGFFGETRKIFAGPGGVEFGLGDIPGGIHADFHNHADRALDRGQGSRRNLRENLIEHLAVTFDVAGGFRSRIVGIRPQYCRRSRERRFDRLF